MRRMLLLGGAVLVLVTVAVVALASDEVDSGKTGPDVEGRTTPAPVSGPFALAASEPRPDAAPPWADRQRGPDGRHLRDRPRGQRPRLVTRIVDDLAGRLDVDPAHIELALGAVRAGSLAHAVDTGLISVEERLALEACLDGQSDCAPARARHVVHTLREGITPVRLAEYKRAIIKRMAFELDRPEDVVEKHVRAELDMTLHIARRMGRMTDHARDIVLDCFDRPRRCDAPALRRVARTASRAHR